MPLLEAKFRCVFVKEVIMCVCECVYVCVILCAWYRVFHRFVQAKFAYGGSVLGSSQFTLLPHLPLKTMLNLKVVKSNSKIIIFIP